MTIRTLQHVSNAIFDACMHVYVHVHMQVFCFLNSLNKKLSRLMNVSSSLELYFIS